MLKPTEGLLAHEFIVKDLVVRTLEVDRERLGVLKAHFVYDKVFERLIKEQRAALLKLKNELASHKVIYQGSKRLDDEVTLYYFVQSGGEHEYRYANIALRNHTYKELDKLFGLE